MSAMVLFFLVLSVIPVAWFVTRQFDDTTPILITWVVAGVIIFAGILGYFFRTVDQATNEGGLKIYKDISDGKF